MGAFRRVIVLPVVGLMACGSLSACYMGPDPVQYGALAVVGGKPVAVIALCGRSTSGLDVLEHDDEPQDGKTIFWMVKVTVAEPAQDVDVELFGAGKAGVQVTAYEKSLKSFEPGYRYTLNASKGGPEGTDAPEVSFTTDDFARIGDGQVLAPIDYKKSDVVARETFVSQACAKKGPGA